MKEIIKIIVSLIVMMAYSYAGPYPIVSSIKTKITGPGSADYTVKLAVVDVPAADAPAPPDWLFVLAHRHDNFPGGSDTTAFYSFNGFIDAWCWTDHCAGVSKPGESFSQTAMRVFTANGGQDLNFVVQHAGYGNGGECVGYVFLPKGADSKTPWSNAVMPGNTCIYAPPGSNYCEISTPSITIDHGTLILSDADGSEASQWINMRCTTATSVTLRLATDLDYISLKNNARANIKVDGVPVGGKFNFPKGNTAVEIKSILENITQVDDYTGFTVMIVEPA